MKQEIRNALNYMKIWKQIISKYSINDDSIISQKIKKHNIDIYIIKEQYKNAIELLDDLISKTKNDQQLYMKRAIVMIKIHKYSESISDLKLAYKFAIDEKAKDKIQSLINEAKNKKKSEDNTSIYSIFGIKMNIDLVLKYALGYSFICGLLICTVLFIKSNKKNALGSPKMKNSPNRLGSQRRNPNQVNLRL